MDLQGSNSDVAEVVRWGKVEDEVVGMLMGVLEMPVEDLSNYNFARILFPYNLKNKGKPIDGENVVMVEDLDKSEDRNSDQ